MAFPSTFQDIQNAVIVKARLDPILDLSKVKDWINQTYSQVCVETEAIVTFATLTMTASSATYTFPPQVARVRQMFVTPAGQTSANQQLPMTRTTLDDILRKRSSGGITANGGDYSRYYSFVGVNDFEVWPTPAAADVITLYYASYPTALVNVGDLPVIEEPYASKLLEYGALVQAGDFKGDPGTADWQADYDQWMGRYFNHLEQKQGDIPTHGHQWGSLADTQGLYVGW